MLLGLHIFVLWPPFFSLWLKCHRYVAMWLTTTFIFPAQTSPVKFRFLYTTPHFHLNMSQARGILLAQNRLLNLHPPSPSRPFCFHTFHLGKCQHHGMSFCILTYAFSPTAYLLNGNSKYIWNHSSPSLLLSKGSFRPVQKTPH